MVAFSMPASAQVLEPFDDPDERMERLEPPLPLPESFNSTVRPAPPDAPAVTRVDSLRGISEAVRSCWQRPAGSGFSGQEITIRVAFKRSGEVLGRPKITYYKPGGDVEQRERFTRSVEEAFMRCSPLPFTETLGRAVAGRIFTFRFIDAMPL
jgi:hypothetical protein